MLLLIAGEGFCSYNRQMQVKYKLHSTFCITIALATEISLA
jgi:hypothetical protein